MVLTNPSSTVETSPLVLLVEDNPVALRLVESITREAGCRFISVTNGEQAFDLFERFAFDMVITDLGLPGISGIELTIKIRQREKALNKPSVPIVGLTAHSLQETEIICLQSGMNKVLTKPIYLHIMQDLMQQFLQVFKGNHK